MTASGIGSGVNTRVGNELGAGNGARASLAFRTAAVLVLIFQCSTAGVMWSLQHQVMRVFTDSAEITAAALRVMPVLAVSFVTDGFNCILGGVLRGAGKQSVGAVLNLLGYWCVGLPLALLLGLHARLGALGFWLALLAASAVQNVIQLVFILRMDWQAEAQRAQREAMEEALHAGHAAAAADVPAAAPDFEWACGVGDVAGSEVNTPASGRANSEAAAQLPLLTRVLRSSVQG